MKIQKTNLLWLLFFVFLSPVVISAQVFVDRTATGANDGSSWTNAYTDLGVALTNTTSGEVWVANGTYRPTTCNPCGDPERLISFNLPPDVQLYGGFAGNETQRNQRDWTTNLCILSGDIGVSNDSTDNSFRVLTAENSTTNTILDGFIIEEGNADGSSLNGTLFNGGGIFVEATSGTGNIQVRNCTIRNNFAGGGGGMAIYCILGGVSEALIRNCVFEGNTASTGNVSSTGAGIQILGNSGAQIRPRIIGCTFRNNFVGNDGGGISMTPSGAGTVLAPLIDSCLFENNGATDRGAAIWYRMVSSGEMNVVIKNSQFISNQSGGQGGAVFARASFDTQSNDTLINCLFSQNISDGTSSVNDGEGGALFIRGSQNAVHNHQIINCVFDRNFAVNRGGAVGSTSTFATSGGTCNGNFVNCTFYGNKTDGDGGAVHAEGTDGVNNMTFTNNIFWRDSASNAANEFFNNGATITLSYSDIDGGIPAGITDGGNNLDTIPQFSDPENGDLHLTGCSPLINIGDNSALPPNATLDLDGNPRIHEGIVDYGAYEIGIIYVDKFATGANNGKSWDDAFTEFSDGINVALSGDQVWVASATYSPVSCSPCDVDDRLTSFQIKPDVEVYGGFNGTETELEQRDWVSNPTILSGDIGVQNDSTDNSFRVITAENSTTKTILDGFIIEEGNADGSSLNNTYFNGGGIFVEATSGTGNIQVRNCTIRNNFAGGGGGMAIYCILGGESEALIQNCVFEGNTASTGNVSSTGAGIQILGNSGAQIRPRIIGCTFRNNFVGNDGGGISMTPSGAGTVLAPVIDSCLFENNVSTDRGAAIWYRMVSFGEMNVVISNCQFISNRSGGQGGAVFARVSFSSQANDTLINCLFFQNISDGTSTVNDGEGGALFIRGSQDGIRNHQIINCVFDRNFATDRGGAVASTSFFASGGTCNSNFVNCTFFGNSTDGDGGAVHAEGTDGVNNMTFTNSIFWEDTDASGGNEFFNNGATITVSHSDVDGGIPAGVTDGGNNLDVNPLFVDAANGDLHLIYCSPANDVGSNTAMPLDLIDLDGDGDRSEQIDLDLDGFARIFNSTIDLGAYEFNTLSGDTLQVEIRNINNVSCNGESDGSVTVVAENGVEPYTYAWSDPLSQTTATASGLAAGTYTVTVTDTPGCSQTVEVTIEEPELLELVVSTEDPACNGENTGSITVDPSGGTGTYTYAWSDDPTRTSNIADDLGAGTYSFTITDANNCVVVASSTLSEPEAINGNLTSTDVTCNGESDGSITLTATGGTGNLTYQWSDDPARTNSIASPLGPGDYTVTVVDANGCTTAFTETIVEPDVLSVTVTTTGETALGANDGTATANPTGGTSPYTYNWSNGGTTMTISSLAPDTYTVTVTDANGCTATGSGTVNNFTCGNLELTIDKRDVACFGENNGSATATLSGGTDTVTYAWSLPAATATINNLTAGTYTVTATDATGCTQIAEVTINEPPELTLSLSFTNETLAGANDGTATATPNGGTTPYTFLWSNDSTTANISGLAPGIYELTLTDANGCSIIDEVEISTGLDCSQLEGDFTITNVSCAGESDGAVQGTAVGGIDPYTWEWNTGQNGPDIDGLTAGDYTTTITDANGCMIERTVTVTQPDSLMVSVSFTNETAAGANDGTATANPSGGTLPYTYNWSNAETTQMITSLSPGTYTVTVTDTNGCSVMDEVTIRTGIDCSQLQLEIEKEDIACFGEQNGSITVTPQGGLVPYTYSWSIPGNDSSQTGLEAGSYTVTVTDGNGCTVTETIAIEEPDEFTISVQKEDVTCAGDADGFIFIFPSGGTGAYTFNWSNNGSGQAQTDLSGGPINVTVTDENGCSITEDFNIEEPDELILTVNKTDETAFGANDGTASATASGGVDPYVFVWSTIPVQIGNNITGLAPGTYTVTLTDFNGCSKVDSVTIEAVPPDCSNFSIEIVTTNVSCFGEGDGSIEVNPTGGFEPYVFEWFSGQTDSIRNNLSAGTYTLTITDIAGCQSVETIELTEPAALSLEVITRNPDCGVQSNATALPNGGTAPYSYNWSTGDTLRSIDGLGVGTFGLTVTDANGCSTNTIALIEPGAEGITVEADFSAPRCQGEQNGFIAVDVVNGTAPFTYLWNTGDTTLDLMDIPGGDYTLRITDANDCSYIRTFNLIEPDELDVIFTVSAPSDNNSTDGVVLAEAFGGTTPYTYTWNFNNTNGNTLDEIGIGTYFIIITDANGCTLFDSVSVGLTSTGIEDLESLEVFKLFPNPTLDDIYLDVLFKRSVDVQFDVLDLRGRTIWSQEGRDNHFRLRVNLDDQPGGTYLFRLRTLEGYLVRKFLKL